MRVPMHAPITKPVSHATLGHPAPVNGDSNAPFFRTCGARPGYFECLLGVREDEAAFKLAAEARGVQQRHTEAHGGVEAAQAEQRHGGHAEQVVAPEQVEVPQQHDKELCGICSAGG